jgi:hypothetical protein
MPFHGFSCHSRPDHCGGDALDVGAGGYLPSAKAQAVRREAARTEATGLLAQVADGAVALEPEIHAFRERRLSVRADGAGRAYRVRGAGIEGHAWSDGAEETRSSAAGDDGG